MQFPIQAIRPRVLLAVSLAVPTLLSSQPPPLTITSAADGTRVRPGQTISVSVEVHKTYQIVFLLGDYRGSGSWGFDVLEQATAPPYRFSVTVPDDSNATILTLRAAGCVRPGNCDDSPQQVSIVVEPLWKPSDNVSGVHDAPGVSVDTRGNPLLHRTAIGYPPELRAGGIGGTVVVEITPDSTGHVYRTRVLSGPTELREHVILSVQDWRLPRKAGEQARQYAITFDPARSASEGETPSLASYGMPNTSYCDQDLSVWAARAGSQVSLTILPNGLVFETPEQKRQREDSRRCDVQ